MWHLFYNPICFHHNSAEYFLGLSSVAWTAMGSIAVALTVVYIARQSKYLEYQTRPIAWFFFMSPKTLRESIGGNDPRNWFFVKNESKYTVFLYYKLTNPEIDTGSITLEFQGPWQNESSPLYVYPGLMQYPSVLPELSNELLIKAKEQNKKIRIDIYCSLSPEYAKDERYQKAAETWRFDPINEIWEGPNGIPDRGFISTLQR